MLIKAASRKWAQNLRQHKNPNSVFWKLYAQSRSCFVSNSVVLIFGLTSTKKPSTPGNGVANQFIIILYKPWKSESWEQKVRLILLSHYKHRCSTNTMWNKQLKKAAFFPPLAALAPWPIRKLFHICNLHLQKTIFTATLPSKTTTQSLVPQPCSFCRRWWSLLLPPIAAPPGAGTESSKEFQTKEKPSAKDAHPNITASPFSS